MTDSALCRSGYEARREAELPVLCRWIELAYLRNLKPCRYIGTFVNMAGPFVQFDLFVADVILYSHEQVVKECAAMQDDVESIPIADWHIISLKVRSSTMIPTLFHVLSSFRTNRMKRQCNQSLLCATHLSVREVVALRSIEVHTMNQLDSGKSMWN